MVTLAKASILTVNNGSLSIKFALFQTDDSLRRVLEGRIEHNDAGPHGSDACLIG